MNWVTEYLRIPSGYAEAVDQLGWSAAGDAIEFWNRETFALTPEVVSFLEGFAAQRALVPFAHVLHLLYLLRRGRLPSSPHDFTALSQAYREAGMSPRNAGVFCAVLCQDVPPAPEPPSAEELPRQPGLHQVSLEEGTAGTRDGDRPPLTAAAFEELLRSALADYDFAELVHWFRHGQGPPAGAGEQIARSLPASPPTLRGVLAALVRNARLAGAVPFVERLVSALDLPPRRLDHHELPTGGYWDVVTRGHPEQILPSQFALDDLEFLRRHAENELLYYHREEPHVRTREGLVVLLDQGVRTWGPVRLVLAAAVLALARLAERRRLPFAVAATSSGGVPCDPLEEDRESLARLLEASDLSADPGAALERVLEDAAAVARDVVLLTHPRNLAEPNVLAAARRVGPPTRLFAVTVDRHGEVRFHQLRKGLPVCLSRFRVDLTPTTPNVPEPEARPADPRPPWKGDVEPVGFPFRFGAGEVGERCLSFAFDDAGEWLLVAVRDGMLYAVRTNDTSTEVLPRAKFEGEVIRDVHGVLGVAGGFVVTTWLQRPRAVHYDFRGRTCRVYPFIAPSEAKPGANPPLFTWAYVRTTHTLLFWGEAGAQSVNLSTGSRELDLATKAEVYREVQCYPWNAELHDPDLRLLPPSDRVVFSPLPWRTWLYFDPDRGSLQVRSSRFAPRPFTPMADGRPLLQGCKLVDAVCRHNTLAATFHRPTPPAGETILYTFRGPEGTPVGEYAQRLKRDRFALSKDGRLLARQTRASQVEVIDVAEGGPPRCVSPVGRFPHDLRVELGVGWLLLRTADVLHLARWEEGRLTFRLAEGGGAKARVRDELARAGLRAYGYPLVEWSIPSFLEYDRRRFRAAVSRNLVAAADRFGQVALFTRGGELLCMFFVFRHQRAAWMPDGTCLGDPELLGRPPTPGAAGKIGQALRTAWDRGENP